MLDRNERGGCPWTGSTTTLPDNTSDPNRVYEAMRAKHGSVVPIEVEPGVAAWLLVGFNENLTVLRNPALFARDPRIWREIVEGRMTPSSPLWPIFGYRPNLLSADGPEHQRLRAPLTDAMAKINLPKLVNDVRDVCDGLIDRFIADGTADLIEQYAIWVPILALNRLFGRDDRDGFMLVEMSRAIWTSDENTANAANEQIAGYFAELVAQKRREPGEDLPSWMIHHPSALNDEEVVHGLIQTALGNSDPTTHLIGNTLLALLSDRDFRAASARSGELVEEAINRVLWSDPPIPILPARYARADTEIGGVPIRAGEGVIMGLAASHGDPILGGSDQLARSTKVNRAYLSWGAGPHRCPCEDTARTIVTTGISQLLRRVPTLRLAASADQFQWRPSQFIRGLVDLPVQFTPDSPRPVAPVPDQTDSAQRRGWWARLGARFTGR